jgi:hypothetical protein
MISKAVVYRGQHIKRFYADWGARWNRDAQKIIFDTQLKINV